MDMYYATGRAPDPRTGLTCRRDVSPYELITTAGAAPGNRWSEMRTSRVRVRRDGTYSATYAPYASTRTLAWQRAEYERAMLEPVPAGMEGVADAYARYAVGLVAV